MPLVPPLALFLAKSPLVAKYDVRSVLSASCGAAPLAGDVHRDTCRALGIEQLGQGASHVLTMVTGLGQGRDD